MTIFNQVVILTVNKNIQSDLKIIVREKYREETKVEGLPSILK